jgi:Protein of unknown function (DUF2795)
MATAEMWAFRDATLTTVALDGFAVEARDGAIGKVTKTTGTRDGGYLVVEPGAAMPLGRQVLVPAGFVDTVDLRRKVVSVGLDRAQVKNAPEFDAARPLDESARSALGGYYGGLTQRPPRRTEQTSGQPPSRTRSTSRRQQEGQSGPQRAEPTKAELYERAKRIGLEGRGKMSKAELARALEGRGERSGGRPSQGAPANPIEVQSFLEGVGYPTHKRRLLDEAKSQGASRKVRETLERLPERQYDAPTEVSEAIGELN